jgi:hypothetical protein
MLFNLRRYREVEYPDYCDRHDECDRQDESVELKQCLRDGLIALAVQRGRAEAGESG